MSVEKSVEAYRKEWLSRAKGLFMAAGFDDPLIQEIPNEYWPDAYQDLRQRNPWLLVGTQFGVFKIGWRKRVLSIHWDRTCLKTEAEALFPDEKVTKYERVIHAWTYPKALEYLLAIHVAMVSPKES